jgi:hypothetical protein
MPYTTLATVSAGETIASATWGNIVKQDIEYFLARPNNSILRDNAASYSTTSTSFVDVDATNLKHTISLASTKVLIGLSAAATIDALGWVAFDIDVDGTRFANAGTNGIAAFDIGGSASYPKNCSFTVLITGLATGSHTFKLKWRVNASTARLFSGGGTADNDSLINFWVLEVG